MTNQQAPEIYTLHTVPNKGERPWSGIYTVRADAEHDAKVMRDVTGRDWSVVRLVVADTNDRVPYAAPKPAICGNTPYDEGPFTLAQQLTPPAPAAVVIECGNLYAKVKLTDEAFGTTKVGDKLYRTQAADSVLAELAGADRRAGAAERALAVCKEDVARFEQVRDKMKYQWGSDRRVSFDEVWAEALALKAERQEGSVLEDAARWQMAVLVGNEVMLHPDKRSNPSAVKAYMDAVHSGLDLTGAVDAARKQGAKP